MSVMIPIKLKFATQGPDPVFIANTLCPPLLSQKKNNITTNTRRMMICVAVSPKTLLDVNVFIFSLMLNLYSL